MKYTRKAKNVNLLKPYGYFTQSGLTFKILHYAQRVYLCVLYNSQNKQRTFFYTALIRLRCACLLYGTERNKSLYIQGVSKMLRQTSRVGSSHPKKKQKFI